MLGLTQATQAKSTEKLSSGYRINRAADDAAGLSISEKMRKQIRGLTQASANAQDGISAVQTAEGALAEVQDMLQRMNELAVKAANGTNSTDDRTYIQNEIDQLSTEIDRVAETTKFNESYLLKGDSTGTKGYTFKYKAAGAAQTSAATFNTDTATSLTVSYARGTDADTSQKTQDEVNQLLKSFRDQGVSVSAITTTIDAANNTLDQKYAVSLTGALADTYDVVATNATTFSIQDKDGNELITLTAAGGYPAAPASDGQTATKSAVVTTSSITAEITTAATAAYYDKDGNKIAQNALDKYVAYDGSAIVSKPDAPAVYDAVGNVTTIKIADFTQTQDKIASLSFKLHVGADATTNNQIAIDIDSMSARSLGVNFLKVDGADDSNALGAVETIKEAIQKVSTQRSALGAVQNRLEHTIANLDNVVENTTSAESAIRDTDMATEMVKYSNNNILAQAGQAMLAQANQSNQGVLSLLG